MSYRCPYCGSTQLQIIVEVFADLIQNDDGTFSTPLDLEDTPEYGPESTVYCTDCEADAELEKFKVQEEQPVGQVP